MIDMCVKTKVDLSVTLSVCLFVPICLQILACGFIKSLVVNHCWLIQLFSLACTIKGYTKRMEPSVFLSVCLPVLSAADGLMCASHFL